MTNNAELLLLKHQHFWVHKQTANVILTPQMAGSTRERKKTTNKKATSRETSQKDDLKNQESGINFNVILWNLLLLAVLGGLILYYNIDKKDNGPFAAFISKNLLPKNRYQ